MHFAVVLRAFSSCLKFTFLRLACSVTTEFIIKTLGLEICADTVIGNAMKRGVSGGQKKRVTTGV